jgi:hypothetical protein
VRFPPPDHEIEIMCAIVDRRLSLNGRAGRRLRLRDAGNDEGERGDDWGASKCGKDR